MVLSFVSTHFVRNPQTFIVVNTLEKGREEKKRNQLKTRLRRLLNQQQNEINFFDHHFPSTLPRHDEVYVEKGGSIQKTAKGKLCATAMVANLCDVEIVKVYRGEELNCYLGMGSSLNSLLNVIVLSPIYLITTRLHSRFSFTLPFDDSRLNFPFRWINSSVTFINPLNHDGIFWMFLKLHRKFLVELFENVKHSYTLQITIGTGRKVF